jgi:hypothetical protein
LEPAASTRPNDACGSLNRPLAEGFAPTTDRQASRTICRIAGEENGAGMGEQEGEQSARVKMMERSRCRSHTVQRRACGILARA